MSARHNPEDGRRGFLTALLGFGAAGFAAGISAAGRSPGSDRFAELVAKDVCLSPSSLIAPSLDPSKLPAELTLVGSRLLKLGFLDEIVRVYEEQSKNRVKIIGGGCDDGLIAARLGKAHIGELCCPVQGSPAEGMCWLPVAQDIKLVLTTPDNPIDNVRLSDLRRIMTGDIRNWREVGGKDRPIALIVHNHCPSYLEPVRTTLVEKGKTWSKHAMRSNTDSDHLRHLARFRYSLGVDSGVLAAPYLRNGQLKALHVDGVEPSLKNLESGAYPLGGPLNLIYAIWVEEKMRPFLDFLYSPEAARIIAKSAVPVSDRQVKKSGYAPDYLAGNQA